MSSVLAFDRFRFDSNSLELFESEKPVPLPPNASKVLALLLSKPGRLVLRNELQEAVWIETVVEFDQGLNTCIRQIRSALGDDARNPSFVQTVPRRGYRFCHPVHMSTPRHSAVVGRNSKPLYRMVAACVVLVALAIRLDSVVPLSDARLTFERPQIDRVSISEFRAIGFEQSPAGIDHALEVAVRSRLESLGLLTAEPHENPYPEFLLTGIITPADDGALLHAALIQTVDGKPVWEGSFNPYCREVRGDPVVVIGHLVANGIRAQIVDT